MKQLSIFWMTIDEGKCKCRRIHRLILLILTMALAVIVFLAHVVSLVSLRMARERADYEYSVRYLYWGHWIDCPGKHCQQCEGLGHQESSLRCALEEAKFLQRTFVMPARMCINPIHNKKAIFHRSNSKSSEERWAGNSCAMGDLYDLDLMSKTVPVILDNSETWSKVLSMTLKLGDRGVIHVSGISRSDLKENGNYTKFLLINRTASPLSWFIECKNRKNRSALLLPYTFLPNVVAVKLRNAANQITSLLGDYDAIHVRRGDKIRTRKNQFGVDLTLHPHLDRDTRPMFIAERIKKWIAPGRMLFIASNEMSPGFFLPLSARYRLAYSSNFSGILGSVVENNYQLFMIERLILTGAQTFVRTFKEDDEGLSLTDDPKKNTKVWQKPVYTIEND